MILIFLVTLAVISCLPASIAKNKGRSFGSWWVYGFLLFPIALIHSLAMSKDVEGLEAQAIASGNRKCPACAEMVKVEAIICKHCGSKLEPHIENSEKDEPTLIHKWIGGGVIFAILMGILIALDVAT